MINKGVFLILLTTFFACNLKAEQQRETTKLIMNQETIEGKELATFGNGCFWCTEAIFQQLKGVSSVEAAYAGGNVKNPTYKEVCTGTTGHAEVLRIVFDPKIISYSELLEVFFSTHDPTTLNRQGADVGTQYRSVIFYHNDEQKKAAEAMITALEKENVFDDPIVTEVTALNNYYPAENYHQNYYNNNKNEGYCRAVINPKLEKFKKQYKNKLKENN
ncbi:peptide-methionine (S)-S-oxide reductase [Aureibaculum marinum]|uniref:Peptide methionine sulfoxide reductase MsrA n=1 Tax=Aureibaculum marinum TaxID=2487930 RepID=A0A3N4P4F1_9FLAO|nr:peptide-methionine (S)-S-oxide reductase MsrA [Aureibaculum marinum]RPD98619.1 peptide-methionine (S)-S-oxide reductase [Aureibaculum marinum]